VDTVEIVILLIALIFIISLFVIVYILIKYLKNQPQTNKHYSRKNQSLQIGNRPNQNSSINQLENKLLTMLQGDVATAKRLYRLTKTNNPIESQEWCLEKTIFDLERDRRY
jgi:predicted PurR-regulated permease PerM